MVPLCVTASMDDYLLSWLRWTAN